jgi:nitrite reductase/ring-hydroxylating ferredoxin subunit
MSEHWTKVAAVEDVPENGTLLVRCGSQPVCLYNVAGNIYATHDLCTHGEASLADGFIIGENIECPLHQGLFHISTGKAVGAPCTKDLVVFAVRISDGEIYVAPSNASCRRKT